MKNLKLVTPIFICLLMANKKMNAQQTKELLGQKQVLQTVEQNKQPDRISADANIKERILTPVKDGDYSIMPLILPGDSVEKNYYVKQYGSKVYLNGDIIVKDLSLLSTASYSRNDNKHTFGKNDLYRWPGGVLPIVLESSALELDNYLIIKSALDYFNFNTGIICKERTSEEDYVVIKCVKDDGSGRAGASAVGRQRNGSNILELTKGGFDKVTVLHELMHALGMYHEQSRPDRDNFIEIKWDNVKEAAKFNFQIEDNGTIRSNYDYCSIMQYNTMAFAINQLQPTIVCKSDGVVVPCQSCMGTGATLSQMDLDGLNNLYQGIGISRFPCKIPFVSANHTPQYSEKIEYLPVIGKRTITGYFTWNEYNMHYPTGESPEKIFGFVVQQPEGIIKQYKDIVRDNTPEYFSSQKIKLYPQIIMRPPVATTSYSKTAIVISYSVNFTISNLPENTPLSITPEIKLGFSPGETAITNKKTGEDESNFFVFIDDKTKYPLAYHNTSLNYPVSYSFIDRKSIKEKAATKYNAESKVLIPQNQPNPAVNQQKEIKQIQTIPVTQPAVTPKATRAIIHQ